MGKIIEIRKIENKREIRKKIIYLLFLIILVYIFYSIFLLIKTPDETVTLVEGVLTLEESEVGYVLRNEKVLIGNNYKNDLMPIIAEGERAAKGQTIFRYSGTNEEEIKKEIQEINLKIQEAISKGQKIFSTDLKNIEKQIDDRTIKLNNITDVHTISEYKKEIEQLVNKKSKIIGDLSPAGSYIQELNNKKENLEQQLTANSEYITAPISGIVSYRVDGLEEILSPDNFSNLTKENLEKLEIKTGKIVSASNEKGKVIDNFHSYIVCILNNQKSRNVEIGDKVNITFASGKEYIYKIEYISIEDDETTLIVFGSDVMPEELINFRKISLNITWWSYSGLKVPNSCILEDEQGYSYIVKSDKEENKKILVKVLKRNDKYSIITNYNTEELEKLQLEEKKHNKVSKYDKILLYPKK